MKDYAQLSREMISMRIHAMRENGAIFLAFRVIRNVNIKFDIRETVAVSQICSQSRITCADSADQHFILKIKRTWSRM